MKKTKIMILGIISLSFIVGLYFYPLMPEKMAFHWNARGEVDGYTAKFWGLFLIPLVSLGVFLLFLLIPEIDPLKENINKFRQYFDRFILLLTGFLFYLYLLTILFNLGLGFDFVKMLVPAFGPIFYYAGVLIEHAKQNWFIGIRTPWTLSSETVWTKTHQLAGKLFKISGLISLFGVVFPNYSLFFVLLPLILSTIYLIVYSCFEYQKIDKNRAAD